MINQKSFEDGLAAEGRSAWYLVLTKAGGERLAVAQLRMQGFETYLPMRAPLKAGGAARPLFPSYLFVRVNLGKPGWRAIYSTLGVKDVMSTGSGDNRRPRAMPGQLVPGLMAMECAGLIKLHALQSGGGEAAQGQDATAVAAAGLKPGDAVQVPFGAGRMVDAVLAERVDAKRVAVLISMLGRDSRAVVDLASVVRPSAVAVKRQAIPS